MTEYYYNEETKSLYTVNDDGSLKLYKKRFLPKAAESREIRFSLICQSVRFGNDLSTICDSNKWAPKIVEVLNWMRKNPNMKDLYAQACRDRIFLLKEKVANMAKNSTVDKDELVSVERAIKVLQLAQEAEGDVVQFHATIWNPDIEKLGVKYGN